MASREIREALGVSKQGVLDLLNPLVQAGPVRHIGTRKTEKYSLA